MSFYHRNKLFFNSLVVWVLSCLIFGIYVLIPFDIKSEWSVHYKNLYAVSGFVILGDMMVGVFAFIIMILGAALFRGKNKRTPPDGRKIEETSKKSRRTINPLGLFLILFLIILTYLYGKYNILISNSKREVPPPIAFTNIPTVIPTPALVQQDVQQKNNTGNNTLTDCTGPDGKHFQATFQDCVNFNNAWKGISPAPTAEPGAWGVASQIGEHTWTMNVGNDSKMTTPAELYEALNSYRRVHGRRTLGWNDNLAKFAQQRADDQAKAGKTDAHAGFNEYVKNPENLKSLGFWYVGENSSSGFILSGVHLIEWVYASDKPHNDNQLNPDWNSVGVGVNGSITDIVFGGS